MSVIDVTSLLRNWASTTGFLWNGKHQKGYWSIAKRGLSKTGFAFYFFIHTLKICINCKTSITLLIIALLLFFVLFVVFYFKNSQYRFKYYNFSLFIEETVIQRKRIK